MAAAKALKPVRLLIVDDHPVFRDGLRRLLATLPEFDVVGEAGNAGQALNEASRLRPDLILLDVNIPGSGIEVARQIRPLSPGTAVLLLTSGVSRDELRDALRFGARGLVLKTAPVAMILKAIRAVAAGEHWISRDLVNELAQAAFDHTQRPERPAQSTDLSVRERQVVALAAQGCGNKDIAARLSISEHTVKHHMTSIFGKTGRTSRVDLALYALQHGLATTTGR